MRKNINVKCECVQQNNENAINEEKLVMYEEPSYNYPFSVLLLFITFPNSCPNVISIKNKSDTSHFGHEHKELVSSACVLNFVPDTNDVTASNGHGKGIEAIGNGEVDKPVFDLQLLSVKEQEFKLSGSQINSGSTIHDQNGGKEEKVAGTHDILNELKFRDGSSRIDPLLKVSDYSIINQVSSGKLRIERSETSTRGTSSYHEVLEVKMRLTVRMREDNTQGDTKGEENGSEERFMAVSFRNQQQQPLDVNEQHSLVSLYHKSSLFRYSMFSFGSFLILTCVSFLLTCLTSGIRPHKVTINSRRGKERFKEEGSDEQKENLTNSQGVNCSSNGEGGGKCSLSQFDLEPDSNSLELDYYDYHQCDLSHKVGDIETSNKVLSSLISGNKTRIQVDNDQGEGEGSIQNIDSD